MSRVSAESGKGQRKVSRSKSNERKGEEPRLGAVKSFAGMGRPKMGQKKEKKGKEPLVNEI